MTGNTVLLLKYKNRRGLKSGEPFILRRVFDEYIMISVKFKPPRFAVNAGKILICANAAEPRLLEHFETTEPQKWLF